jgi:hypothetical protein
MTVLNRNPQNTNLLQPTKFLLVFSRLPSVQYFCQTVNIPGVSLGEVVRETPFLDMYSPGTKLKYDPFDIDFLIDEELTSWKNMYDWFISIADPDGFEKRDGSIEIQKIKHLSDATLTILSGLNNPLVRIQFRNTFPLTMTDLNFDTKESADTIMSCKATFRYESYNYLTV